MKNLYNKLKKYTLKNAIKIEEQDRQFIALKVLQHNINNKELYLALIVSNSIICYQLSWKWENYWEEFSEYFSKQEITKNNLIDELWIFIANSKNNKRFVSMKQKRLEKLRPFLDEFLWNSEYFYKNMTELRDKLAKTMKQKIEAKTIVFAVKMFGYWARNIYEFTPYPENIFIPIDSRLIGLFEKYKQDYDNINKFYLDLANKLNIPILHLDWIVWTLYDELIREDV